jgi:hypothetical protein
MGLIDSQVLCAPKDCQRRTYSRFMAVRGT